MKLQKWEKLSILVCLLLMAVVLYFAMQAGLSESTPTVEPEDVFSDDEIADDTPLDGYGYGHREPDCQVKILDALKK